jgi:hypothetical protein
MRDAPELPEPSRWEDRSDKSWPVTVVPAWSYDKLHAAYEGVKQELVTAREYAKRSYENIVEICKQRDAAESKLAAVQEVLAKAEEGKYGSIIKEWINEAMKAEGTK